MVVKKWVNDSYGPGGIFIWVLSVAWFVVVYTIYYWVSKAGLLDAEKSMELYLIDFFVLAVEVFLATFFIIFFIQCVRMVVSIEINDELSCEVKLFYGRKFTLELIDIKEINEFYPVGINSIYTPFEFKKINYKVILNNGNYIFVSGSMIGAQELIKYMLPEKINRSSLSPTG